MGYRIGIDAGSKTVKLVVLDDQNRLVHSSYERHRFDINTTMANVLHDMIWRYGDIRGSVCVTGSAGIGLAEALGLPFVQEVVATSRAVREAFPQANAIIELGGEDAKVEYLDDPPEQRMNATCAGGTGGFIDTIAHMLGTRTRNISHLAMGASRIYPIASRCAVFAQTDVRPLLNAGVSKADIAASALEAVVRQTIGGLACGRAITGTVVFLGGPMEHIPDLVIRFRHALGLSAKTGIKPRNAHLFTACGTAILGATHPQRHEASLAELEALVKQVKLADDLGRLPALFTNGDDLAAFMERHEREEYPHVDFAHCEGPLFVGIDAGSTALKLAAIDARGRMVFNDCRKATGDMLETVRAMVDKLHRSIPHAHTGEPMLHIAHATATGYGEDLLRAALRLDSGVVETLAHTTAALAFDPQLTFLLDIGGQDMKAIWVRDGMVQDALLNEACSSGCGSFIESTARGLKIRQEQFAARALTAPAPVDLGTKCTVFMTSRVRHAQKVGATADDLAAGIAYSVVKNALYRIIGLENLESLGEHIVVQGGAFMSDAVLRAFELTAGVSVKRPADANLMGAIGCALVARERAAAAAREAGCDVHEMRTSMLDEEGVRALATTQRNARCTGCANACLVSIVDFGNGSLYLSGNKCDRANAVFADQIAHAQSKTAEDAGAKDARRIQPAKAPDTFALKRRLLEALRDNAAAQDAPHPFAFGLTATLNDHANTPFWHALLASLGFAVRIAQEPPEQKNRRSHGGMETIPSESVCYPAKIVHQRVFWLDSAGVGAVFMPCYARGRRCPVSSEYAQVIATNMQLSCEMASPQLVSLRPATCSAESDDAQAVLHEIMRVVPAECAPTPQAFARAWQAAQAAQNAFEATLARANERAWAWAHQPGRHGIVLCGRPYHADAALSHSISDIVAKLGFAVIDADHLPPAALSAGCNEVRGVTPADASHALEVCACESGSGNESEPWPHAVKSETASLSSSEGSSLHEGSCAEGDTFPATRSVENNEAAPFSWVADSGAAAAAYAPFRAPIAWPGAKRMMRVARAVAADPAVDAVFLQSFNCFFDGLSLPLAQSVLKAARKPYAMLKIDEMMDTAHIRIRLRTLAQTIQQLEHRRDVRVTGRVTGDVSLLTHATETDALTAHAPVLPQGAPDLPANIIAAAEDGSLEAFTRFEDADTQAARMHNRDLCFVASAVAGRAIRLLAARPALPRLVMPRVCIDCLLTGIPDIIRQACGACPPIEWVDAYAAGVAGVTGDVSLLSHGQEAFSTAGASGITAGPGALDAAASASEPATFNASVSCDSASDFAPVGVVGPAPLVFSPGMNDHLEGLVHQLGCTLAFPAPEHVTVNDVRYEAALQAFAEQGITRVLYLQSFGCVKGHVQSRGALKELAARFPDMQITVIDYDAESAALTRENRIRLALS